MNSEENQLWGELRGALSGPPGEEAWRTIIDCAVLLGEGAQEYVRSCLRRSAAWSPRACRPLLNREHLDLAESEPWTAELFGSVRPPLFRTAADAKRSPEEEAADERRVVELIARRKLLWLTTDMPERAWLSLPQVRSHLAWEDRPLNPGHRPALMRGYRMCPSPTNTYWEVVIGLDRLLEHARLRGGRTPSALSLVQEAVPLADFLPPHLRGGPLRLHTDSAPPDWEHPSWRERLRGLAGRSLPNHLLNFSLANSPPPEARGLAMRFPGNQIFRPLETPAHLTRLVFTTSSAELFPSALELADRINIPAELSGPTILQGHQGTYSRLHYLRANAARVPEGNPRNLPSWDLPEFEPELSPEWSADGVAGWLVPSHLAAGRYHHPVGDRPLEQDRNWKWRGTLPEWEPSWRPR